MITWIRIHPSHGVNQYNQSENNQQYIVQVNFLFIIRTVLKIVGSQNGLVNTGLFQILCKNSIILFHKMKSHSSALISVRMQFIYHKLKENRLKEFSFPLYTYNMHYDWSIVTRCYYYILSIWLSWEWLRNYLYIRAHS